MSEITRAKLFGKLTPLAYKTIESATTLCRLRGNPYVEIEHWVAQILQAQDSDWHRLIRHFEIDAGRLLRDVTAALDRLPRGAASVTDLSVHVESAVERGWVFGSLMFGARAVRTGHLLLAALKTPSLRHVMLGLSRQLERIGVDALASDFEAAVAGSPERGMHAADGTAADTGAPGTGVDALSPVARGEALARYTVDLTARARSGAIDPVVGRDEQIRQMIDILMRRRQNNPLLAGEAGVGKTAVVEGLASRIAGGDVPPQLRDVSLLSLDLGLLQAGASMKGEFEQRLSQLIEEIQSSVEPIVLFVDEVHTLIGAGGQAGTGDAANLLKPALARGDLRTIGATTWSEYKRHIEKDPALTRRFQVVQVPEPSEPQALRMVRAMAATLERHHRVLLLDEALEAAVRLSHRYIPARQLPDKAISLIDTACARVAVSQHATPADVEDCRRRIEAFGTELSIVEREAAIGIDVSDRRARAQAALASEEVRMSELDARWEEERKVVERVLAVRATLRCEPPDVGIGDPGDDRSRDALLEELRELQTHLAHVQGDSGLVMPSVDESVVAAVVADWTGVPVGRMVKDEIRAVLELTDTLGKRVIGQGHALETIARRIQTSRARLDNPDKPVGVFLLCGTSGVGKTETAVALAEALYGGAQNLISINMSEFQEAHTVSTLKGAPPGYVGYGEGGVLTEAVRRRPYSVVLLDEVEKAHPDVHELFFQVFDKGHMEDGEGRQIDFRNTVILLTSNVGSDVVMRLCRDPDRVPDPETLAGALRAPLLETFPAALLGRMVTVPYLPLSDDMMRRIVRLQLERIGRRVRDNHGVPFDFDDAAVNLVVSRCTEAESGGRVVDAIVTNTVLPKISTEYLKRLAAGRRLAGIALSAADGEFRYAFD